MGRQQRDPGLEEVVPHGVGKQLGRRVVGRRHQRSTPVDEALDQAREEDRVAGIVDVQLIEEHQTVGADDVVDRASHGIRLRAMRVNAPVQIIEEAREVHTGGPTGRNGRVDRIGEPGLAAPGRAVEVHTLRRSPLERARRGERHPSRDRQLRRIHRESLAPGGLLDGGEDRDERWHRRRLARCAPRRGEKLHCRNTSLDDGRPPRRSERAFRMPVVRPRRPTARPRGEPPRARG